MSHPKDSERQEEEEEKPSEASVGEGSVDRPSSSRAENPDGEKNPARKSDGGIAFPVVGIGASAGGLEAFKQLLSAMPSDSGAAFVLIQHLDPQHESMMAELLAKYTSMPVDPIEDDTQLRRNHVYMIPPNAFVEVSGNRLRLVEPVKDRGMRMPIDVFFRSLAGNCRERAIAVILSGTGSDGTAGMKDIKGAGGMTMVEDPRSASYEGMPRAALKAGVVDFVLPVSELPETLVRYINHPYILEGDTANLVENSPADHLRTILALLQTRTDYDFHSYKKGTLTRRIERRLGIHHLESLEDYVTMLRNDPDEVRALFRDLLISVTSHFRDPEAWEDLEREVIARVVREKDFDEPVRVWIPGCATGEEAYTVAILLFEQFSAYQKTFNAQIFATDIDEEAIQRARAGRYPKSIASELSPERLGRFFEDDGDDEYLVKKKLRESVVFAIQNLIGDPPFSNLDLICCRNLLIYLEGDIQERILQMFHFSLADDGYLFIGNSESAGRRSELFQTVNKTSRIYRKTGKTVRGRSSFPISGETALENRLRGEGKERREIPPSVSEIARSALLDRYAPASVLINRSCDSLFFHGPVGPYLDYPSGEPTRNLSELVVAGLKNKLRGLVHQAVTSGEAHSATAPRIERGEDQVTVRITVEPVEGTPALSDLLLVTFEDERSVPIPQQSTSEMGDEAGADSEYVGQLEHELQSMREDLQSTIEELETSNEELKASNEEVLSMNEELQSTNEELETSREELQSLNEELSTLNNQLEEKVDELEEANNDLSNLLGSTNIATIFLDTEFRIRRFTPATLDLVSLIPSDVGRPFRDIATHFSDEHLLEDARRVLDKLAPVEREIRHHEGGFYIRRALPYRTEDNRIEGIVITFTDVTELRERSEQIEIRRRQQAAVAELGTQALADAPAVSLFEDATLSEQSCRTISRVLDVPLVKFLKLEPDANHLRLVAGYGWADGLVGNALVRTDRNSQAGFTLDSAAPVIVEDLGAEKRFSGPDLLLDHDVVSGISVTVGPASSPWGVLGAHDRRRREFAKDDVHFLQSVAHLVYIAVEQQQTLSALRESEERYRLVANAIPALIAYCDRETVYRFCNESYREWFGVAPEEIVGQTVEEFLGEEAFGRIAPSIRRVLGGERVSFDSRLSYANGPARHVHIDYIPHLIDGEVLGYYAMVQDFSDRARAAETSRQLAAIVETSQHAILSKDLDGTIRSWNRGAEMLYGYPAEEMMGQNASLLVPPPRRDEFRNILDRVRRGERIDHLESVRLRKDGSPVDVSLAISPILDENDRVVGASAIAMDISGRKEASERLNLALEAGEMGVWDWDPATGLCHFDERVCRLLGFEAGTTDSSLDEFLGLLHPDDRDPYSEVLKKARDGESIHEGEFRVKAGDGYRWLATRFHVKIDDKGEAQQLIGLDWDITATKETERDLRETKNQLEQRVAERTRELQVLSDNVPALFAFLDRELRFRFLNKLFEEKLAMSADAFLGERAEVAFTKENFREISRHFDSALSGEAENFEAELNMPRVGTRVIRAHLVPRREDDGAISGLFFLADDITDERRLQQELLEAGEREKARVGRDLHDSICQELSAISLFTKAFVGTVEESFDDAHRREADTLMEKINQTTQNARKLARGLSPVSLEKKTLPEALDELSKSVHELYEGVTCEFTNLTEELSLDEQVAMQLYLIARESVFNAARHADPDRIRIALSNENSHLLLSVADDGGFSTENLEKNEGLGVRSMRYRARALGGSLILRDSSLGDGVEVLCRLRIDKASG